MTAADKTSPEQFDDFVWPEEPKPDVAMGLTDLHPSLSHGSQVPTYLKGPVLDHVYERAGITRHPFQQGYGRVLNSPTVTMSTEMPPTDEPLHTTQELLVSRTIKRFGEEGVPTEGFSGEPIHPRYMTGEREGEEGTETWIVDGHHRTVTSRLKAKES